MSDLSRLQWLRWAFNCANWIPKVSEWTFANQCIQAEEVSRIDRFVFQDSAKSSMIGRLLLRKAARMVTNLPNNKIEYNRTENGKPFISIPLIGSSLDVNVSHHGSWVILGLEATGPVGVDVVSLERPVNITLDKYFVLMQRQFTDCEWQQINASSEKLHTFYRFWCLKESYIKATGVGLGFDLQTISFVTKEDLRLDEYINSTTMYLNGEIQLNWTFEEHLLDSLHCASVCTQFRGTANKLFTKLCITDLWDEDEDEETVFRPPDLSIWNNFSQKLPKPK